MRGSKHVPAWFYDDKRQYTGNIVHNALGNFVTMQLVYGGTTDRSLPTKFPEDWVVGYSVNHWSNLVEKKRLVDSLHAWRTAYLQEK